MTIYQETSSGLRSVVRAWLLDLVGRELPTKLVVFLFGVLAASLVSSLFFLVGTTTTAVAAVVGLLASGGASGLLGYFFLSLDPQRTGRPRDDKGLKQNHETTDPFLFTRVQRRYFFDLDEFFSGRRKKK